MLRLAIVENSFKAAEQIKECMGKYQAERGLVLELEFFENGRLFMDSFRDHYDIIFLDIEMPELNGIDTAREIRKINQNVILVFVTRMAQYAVNGYEVHAMDFMVKPLSYPAFSRRMDLLLERLPEKKEEESIVLQLKTGMKKMRIAKIYYIEVSKHTVTYHTQDGLFETIDTMKHVESMLEKKPFARCDNCYLVNLQHVESVGKKEVTVDGEILNISRPRRKEFLEKLSEYIHNSIG